MNIFLVTDSTAARGGEAKAWLAGELLLASLATCAVSSVTAFARESNWQLADVSAEGISQRHASDETRYEKIVLTVDTAGITQQQAAELVRKFTRHCPVFGTVSRGGVVELIVNGEPLIWQ
ncbi:OsmC family protein [Serratia liquefaciens]|uniref:OsmC family protein n=1 Tax=Serratia liquefaciens TaxID=614 RepID=UPI0022DD6FEC|nr:OsmC family protein [Serratia liquefaciens]WBL73711.1 OsmC family protein [Serratia liquefaciens]